MAHNAQAVFFKQVKKTYPAYFRWSNVLEVGSLDINGTVRNNFENCNYVGVDLELGPGVDLAVQGQDLQFPPEAFNVTISAECFEHNPYWRETFLNMKRMTKRSGLITFSCAGKDRPEHGTSRTDPGSSPFTTEAGWDYYRNLEESDFDEEMLRGLDYQFFYNPGSQDLYFIGFKVSDGGEPFQTELIEELPWNDINAENF